MTCIKTNEFAEIYKLISTNVQEGILLELIRKFKEAVKNFVYEQNNPNALSVVGVEDIKDGKDLVAFHIGKAESISDRKEIIKSNDLTLDVLFNNIQMSADDVLKVITREKSLFPKTSYTPIYRYLKKCNNSNVAAFTIHIYKNKVDAIKQCSVVNSRILSSEKDTIDAINSTNVIYTKLSYLSSNIGKMSTISIRKILIDIYNMKPDIFNSTDKSTYKKLVFILDYLENL